MSGSPLEAEALQLIAARTAKLQKHKEFQCVCASSTTLDDIIRLVHDIRNSKSNRRRDKVADKFDQCCDWLHQISGAIDIVVQTEATIGSPIWAPIKLVVLV